MRLEYFGTSLNHPGHYFFVIDKNDFCRSQRRPEQLPFNVEQLPWAHGQYIKDKGQWMIYNFCGFTIFAISGSPTDTRGGCKSVFFVEENLSNEKMWELITANPLAMQIVNKINGK